MIRFASLLLFALPALLRAEDTAQPFEHVLALGPLPIAGDALNEGAKAEELRRALVMQVSPSLPAAGSVLHAFGEELRWQATSPGAASDGPTLWSVNLETARFTQVEIEVGGLKRAHLFLNGASRTLKDGKVKLELANGSHRLLLLHEGREGETAPRFAWHGKPDALRSHLEPTRRVSAELLTNAKTAGAMALSPDGRRLAVAFSRRDDVAAIDIAHLELRDTESGRVLQTWAGSAPSAPAFSPDGRWLGYREGKNLWLVDLREGGSRLLLANHEHLGAWLWHPDSRSILFLWTTPFEAKDAKVKRLRALEDRWKTFRDNAQLHQVDITSGLVRPLTRLDSSVTLLDVHPDGNRVLLSERVIDYAEPPHGLFRVFELTLSDLAEREVGRYRHYDAWRYAEDGFWVLAGPAFMDGAGLRLSEGLTPNFYDTQLYRVNAELTEARTLSADFDPAFGTMERLHNGDLVLTATAGDRSLLYRFDTRRGRIVPIDTGIEVTEAFATAPGRSSLLAVRGSRGDAPQRLVVVDAERGRPRTLWDSQPTQYAHVKLGEVRAWTFDNREGQTIDGRYYLPPDFDPSRKYPLIVYYYGGTTPVNRQFTGRYPFHLWAAHGYVIYVVQPRGTIGYGQEFSALHVNAWGRYTADDILDGTEAFVAAHDFVDGKRIGNIGASYGGFMTMHLATLTDRYAASISHAGISSLTAYWGQGWWGYAYSGIASRDSFPWNNPELYVGQSPVYHADRITTPLLLLTGDGDTNVPPGESHSMFTALKLLGREVELVEVPGQDHWILDREKRYVWWNTILAWYDRWLKDEPDWWHALYPETKPKDPS
ncbi:MAG TPA: prolyl oligopeptidase family serine peptidase [Xanthomonadaceae bacterium]|nr:prolyl oligopeptidase family serine peptidase [Xanthomonadaceae bacterium]